MENLDPEHRSKTGKLDSNRKKIQSKNLSLRNKFSSQKQSSQSSIGEPEDSDSNSKKNENIQFENNSASTSSRRSSNDVSLTENNDSLCDFRSPIKDDEINDSLADFRIKPTNLKSNKRSVRREIKSVVNKKRRDRDISANINQPSIESSFFKPQNTVKTAFVCPLCFKSYKDSIGQRNHMKNCAAKNKISTNKLLDAVELQEKQAKERKAMGLLAAPPIQPKKTISKKFISEKDPQLQLALALSMSLHEAQVTEEFEDAHLLAGEPCLPITSEMTEERRKTLQNFGFTTNRPATASTSGKSRKKRPTGPTALQTRTQEERDRLLTVRIAEVLMGDEAITQALLENVGKCIKSEENIVLKSRLLQSYHCREDRLWDRSQQSLSGRSPYSCNLVEVSPIKVKPEHKVEETEQGTSKIETPDQGNSKSAEKVDEDIVSVPMKLESSPGPSSLIEDKREKKIVKRKADENSATNLSKDWRSMLGASYLSDVLIIVKGEADIHAHQVVLWARCYDIIRDMTENDPERFWEIQKRVLWPETDLCSAYAFLEYIYCGVIDRWVEIFDNPNLLAEVRALARKYRLKELFSYLRDKAEELKSGVEINLKENRSEDCSSALGKDESSMSSVESDINSVSTVCNDQITSNKQIVDGQSGDNLGRKNFEHINLKEKENISNNLLVDCFSSSNDSFHPQIPNTSSSIDNTHEKLSIKDISKRISTTFDKTLDDKSDTESFGRSILSPRRKNRNSVNKNENNNDKPINQSFGEEDRCTSPDIFDDSTTTSFAAYTYTTAKKLPCDSEHDTNRSDRDIQVLHDPIQSFELNEKSAPKADISHENNCKKSEKLRVDDSFVSIRRRGRISKQVFSNVENLNSETGNFDKENNVSESCLKKKGDITIAIERIQRLNAKTVSESDSECESVETFPIKKHKNRFRINATNTSSVIEDVVKDDEPDEAIPSKRRNKLSIFEKKIELEAAKNPAMFNLTNFKPVSDEFSKEKESDDTLKSRTSSSGLQNVEFNQKKQKAAENEDRIEPSQRRSSKPEDTIDAFFDLTQESSKESNLDSEKEEEEEEDDCNITTDDKDLSMFTKYKRKHSHNSIDKYRAALRNINSRSPVSSSKHTDEVLSSDDLLSSNDELWDTKNKVKRNSFSSKYEYTDPDQSTSNFERELSNRVSKSREEINISPQTLSSTESDNRAQSPEKLDDVELSDLEIELSDFSDSRSFNRLDNRREEDSKTQGASKRSANRSFDDKRKIEDSLTDIKLEDTDFTIMKNDRGNKETNISDQETDTECFIESIKDSKIVDKSKRKSDYAYEEKSSDIYNEETDTGEMEDKYHEPRYSGSKIKADATPNDVSKEKPKSDSSDEDRRQISSPDCEISGIISPPLRNLNVSNYVEEDDNFVDESRRGSQRFGNSRINLDHRTSQATTSNSLASPSTSGIAKGSRKDLNLLDEVSDSEFDDIEFGVYQDYGKTNHDDKLGSDKSLEVAKSRKSMNEKPDESCYVLDSDSSDDGSYKIHKAKTIEGSISLENNSRTIGKRSIQSRRKSITPDSKSCRSSLRSLGTKSISENIIQTKSKNGIQNFDEDDSFDRELARVQTPTIKQRSTMNNINQRTPQQEENALSENVTPLANYSAMKTPELSKELQKYGIKAQKRHRAKQLLRHIYNELHPLVPIPDKKNIASYSNESSSEDERPPPKKMNRSNSFEAVNSRKNTNDIESDCETLGSDIRTLSDDASNDNKESENDDSNSLSQSDNSEGLENTFKKLIEVDRSLHNKILAYEPIILEELHSTLKAQGLKCKVNSLIDFLDEQCITFRTLANAKKNRTRRKASPKKNQNTR